MPCLGVPSEAECEGTLGSPCYNLLSLSSLSLDTGMEKCSPEKQSPGKSYNLHFQLGKPGLSPQAGSGFDGLFSGWLGFVIVVHGETHRRASHWQEGRGFCSHAQKQEAHHTKPWGAPGGGIRSRGSDGKSGQEPLLWFLWKKQVRQVHRPGSRQSE